jgi:two-component system chemotaxis response regulator CheB
VPNIVVIGASAGGVEVLRRIAALLPADLQAAIFVVMHLSSSAPSYLSQILNSAGPLTAEPVSDGEPIRPSRIYVAPQDRHLLIEEGRIRLTRGPRENRFRPAIDPLFRSAARAYGPRVLGIVLTGLLGDGTAGLQVVKTVGGMAMVQDPKEAPFDSMPLSAIRNVQIDFVLPAAEIPGKIVELAQETWTCEEPSRERQEMAQDERTWGQPSAFTCPDCSGTLWELERGGVVRFRCRAGHAYSYDGMRAEYSETGEYFFPARMHN